MIFKKESPKGVDREIQRLQLRMYDNLLNTWGIGSENYDCYDRVYRDQDEKGRYIPEAYIGNKEYQDPMMNDEKFCTSFFGVGSDQQQLGGRLVLLKCHLIFSMNIAKLYPAVLHRADEEAHVDCLNALRKALPRDTITELITWHDNVFREYNGYKAQNAMKHTDMHPLHIFRINFDLTITLINNNC